MQPDKQEQGNTHKQINEKGEDEDEEKREKRDQGKHQQKLSKKKIKKIAKKQKWQIVKKQKKEQKKQKEKKKKMQRKLQQYVNPKQEMVDKNEIIVPTRKRKDQYQEKMGLGVRVVIDIQFYDQMTQKEQNSLIKQLSYCHCANRQAKKPFNFIITSANEQRQNLLNQKYNAQNWGIKIHKQSLLDLFPVNQIIYLTGDATEDLDHLDQNHVYIIGGIVDHNRLKRITINYAQKYNIKCRRLPMDGVQLKASVHLAVNHVWEWMLRVYNGQTWGQAIKAVIPSRKIHNQKEEQV